MNYLYLYAFVTVVLLAFAAIIIKVEKMSEMTYEQTQFYNMIKEKLAYKEYKVLQNGFYESLAESIYLYRVEFKLKDQTVIIDRNYVAHVKNGSYIFMKHFNHPKIKKMVENHFHDILVNAMKAQSPEYKDNQFQGSL